MNGSDLKKLYAEYRLIAERQADDREIVAGLRKVATERGIDWSALKALVNAELQDERDEDGGNKRVVAILKRSEYALAYADMLKMNDNQKVRSSGETASSPAADAPAVPTQEATHDLDASPLCGASPAADDTPAAGHPLDIPDFLRRTRAPEGVRA